MNRQKLDKMFVELGVEVLISEAPQTRLWYAEVQTSDGFIAIEKDRATLFVDSRYIEYAKNHAKNVEIVLIEGTSIQDWFSKRNFKKVALEKNYLTKAVQDRILKWIGNAQIEWVDAQELRILKSESELRKMQKVIDISLAAYSEFMSEIQEGMTEKEAAAKLNYLLKKHGAEKEGFDEIIAIGPSSAEPHHHPTDRKIEKGQLLKVDFGAKYKGYTADITRTTIFGEEAKDPKMVEILKIVKEAAAAGRQAVRPGIKAKEIDQVCRKYIEDKGYGKYFLHSTGHGLGIDVHELPSVSARSEVVLEPGMIITVEPGIYIEGLGGARIEDDVLVTETGHYVFSRPEENNGYVIQPD
ncbi:aminopeptidase P family protein [Mycoplasmopsis gallopavonis]|uniref:Xaa-Pro aminopeptidase n=1 Tax=Mycoplasmopsis gallopavonis TaxID=76629 RepID=A0A449B0B4_9BACT|nr:aminopeptidase P family protein [Mycoplasmopsis gallopavonis]RIV16198.1 aminopeptidase P family protein [Mycoplasmopsis gallopavonis]VEU73212.1 Xaa-Pro aminopeptidase [Mycoplasmopsis gallopavonis]